MEPEDLAVARDQSRARQLQDVAVLLKCAFQADGAACGFGAGAALAEVFGGPEDFQPGGALESHGAVASAGGIRDARMLDAVAAAESRSFLCISLDHAGDADSALIEFGERLAQLHEGVGIEGSTEVAQPEDERGTLGPRIGEAFGFAGSKCVSEIRGGIANFEGGHGLGSPEAAYPSADSKEL